jgi:hypothetical protein
MATYVYNDGWKNNYAKLTKQDVENSMDVPIRTAEAAKKTQTSQTGFTGTGTDIAGKFSKQWGKQRKLLRA